MRKTLIQHGNSQALIIDKPILELLKISAETPLEITTDGDRLVIEPVREPARAAVRDAYRKVAKRHGKALKRLAE